MEGAIQVLETEKNAHAIQTDPTNQYLYIPCRTGETIHQFRFNAATGALTPNEPDRAITPTKTGPRHLAFHPKLHVVYFVNEFGNSVTAMRMDPATGTLKPFQTLSTLPGDFVAPSSAADVHLTPDGRFLFASNRGHESIAAFAVDTNSGELTSFGIYPTQKTPRSFAVDDGGRFLYAAGQGSGTIAAYEIDKNNGALKQCATYDAGKNPVWILLVQLHRKI
jgi:6-phosphogluconolactonase